MPEVGKEVPALLRGITVRALVIYFVLLLPVMISGCILRNFTDKSATFHGWFIPLFYIVVINELLGKINPKFRLNAAELLVISMPMAMAAGKGYMVKGVTAGEVIWAQLDWGITAIASALFESSQKDFYLKMAPWFMFPEQDRLTVADILYNGLKPGQTIPWGLLAVPILYWSLVTILVSMLGIWLVFGLFGQPWVEVERLVFPMAIAHNYLITKGVTEYDPTARRSKIFDLGDPHTKAFWIGFIVIGVPLSIAPVLTEVLPAIAAAIPGYLAFQWGELKVVIPPLAAVLPGCYALGALIIDQGLIWTLLPNDVLYTSILIWVIFSVIWQGFAVVAGIYPYEPGMEYRWPWENVPHFWDPFPYGLLSLLGGTVAVGIWQLWVYRDRVRKVFGTITGGEDIVERGLSLKMTTWIGIITFILLVIIWTASGVPIIVSFLYVLFLAIWLITSARFWAELWWHEPNFAANGDWPTVFLFPIGGAIGAWTTAPTWEEGNTYAAFAYAHLNWACGSWVVRHNPLGQGVATIYYRIAHDNNANLKDIFLMMIATLFIGVITAQVVQIWVFAHSGGIRNTAAWSWAFWLPVGDYLRGDWMVPPGAKPFHKGWMWGALGFVLVILIYWLRTRWAWLFLNPIVLAGIFWLTPYYWIDALVALIIKFVGIRVLGAKRFQEYIVPFIAGAVIGFGGMFLIAAIYNFFLVALPKFTATYVP